MNRKSKKLKGAAAGFGAAALIAMMTATTAFGGAWVLDNGQWRYQADGNQQAGAGWIQEGDHFYAIDENGTMRTGWFQDMSDNGRWYYLNPQQGGPQRSMQTGWVADNGRWYFLDTRTGGPRGGLLVGWQWIDGKCYYLDPAQGGAMAAATITPEGYPVDASGAWVDAAGNPYYEAGKGISSTIAADITAQGGFGSDNLYEDDQWDNYSDNSVKYAVNDFVNGNYGKMSSDERSELEEAIDAFQGEYLTTGMSDFEKEIMIIKWLVANCSYEKGENWENSTAYSCIVNGKAQCAGYADAFLQTAKACGLEARYVYNTTHAWNLVKLDGDWYHVDVTWEDPVGSNSYGFSSLRNKYINLEDSQIKGISSHRQWWPDTTKARGVAYGPKVVAQYLKDNTIDTSKGKKFAQEMDEFFAKVRNEDGSNMMTYTDPDQTAEAIKAYLDVQIGARKDNYALVIRYPSSFSAGETGNYSKLVKLNNQIEDSVNNYINTKYQDVLKNQFRFSLFLKVDANSCYYVHNTGTFRYQEGKGKQVDYVIHFIDVDGNEVGTQSGSGEKGKTVKLEFPSGYSWISDAKSNYKVKEGSASYSGRSFKIIGTDAVDMEVRLRTVEEKKPSKASDSEAEEMLD